MSRKPTVLGVTTSAAVLEESVAYVRADAQTGATSITTPSRSTTVKISMKPRSPSSSKSPAIPAVKVEACKPEISQHTSPVKHCPVEHCRGTYYRAPYIEHAEERKRSPSPTKTMPNFARQYSLEGDSIFGYKVRDKDPLGTVAGADKSASNSDEEKPKSAASRRLDELRKAQKSNANATQQKRTLADRWPWIRREGGSFLGKGSGEPPKNRAPDPPVKPPAKTSTPVKSAEKRPASVYVSPFEALAAPPSMPLPARSAPVRPVAAAARATTHQADVAKKSAAGSKSISSTGSDASLSVEAGLKQIQDLIVLGVKVGLALYVVVALWFVLDAVREALCVVCVPLQYVVLLVWAVVSSAGRALGGLVGSMGGKMRLLGR